MALSAGTRLGSYEVLAQIGAGGMGEVYKARDSRLDRFVAIKVIPESLAADRDLLARFEREAKAVAALSHPNVMGIHDFGKENGVTFAVMELLEGESLRQKLKVGPLPPKRAIEIAIELATGLGAAHAHGIVHRDVKPENVFVTQDGHVKVLDFGLAKQAAAKGALHSELTTSGPGEGGHSTEKGTVLGTVGYMSPEQVRGEAADQRADVFAFGVVLYEMLSGTRPFGGDTAVQTMSAILEKEPAELSSPKGALPPGLERIVAHCLEKRPEARFQSMADIAFDLQSLSSVTSTPPGKMKSRRTGWRGALLVACSAAGGALAVTLLGLAGVLPFGKRPVPPGFVRITHQPGTIESARFGPDGKTVYFSQRVNGGRPEILVLFPGNREPKPLGIPDALLAAVSASNDLAVLRGPRAWASGGTLGTLSQVKGGEGPLKEVQERVSQAAWDGQALATISTDEVGSKVRLEFSGKVLVEAETSTRLLSHLCISRGGSHIALVDTGEIGSSAGIVSYDQSGGRRVLYSMPNDLWGLSISGLAFGPGGDVWCSQIQEDQTAVWSVAPGGRPKVHWRGPGLFRLMDVSAAGRLLLAQQKVRMGVLAQRPGSAQPVDLSVRDGSQALSMSGDGQTILVLESPVLDGGVAADRAYLRRLDGSPALLLARGMAFTLSRDGRWVQLDVSALPEAERDPAILAAFRQAGLDPSVALDPTSVAQPYLLFVPTGPGRPRVVPLPDSLPYVGQANLLPDGEHLLFLGAEKGHTFRWFLTDWAGKKVRPVSPEGHGVAVVGGQNLSRDGKRLWVFNGKSYLVQELSGGDPIPVKGLEPAERVVGWASDDRSFLIRTLNDALPVVISRFDPMTGARQRLLSLDLPDKAGFLLIRGLLATPDASTVVYTYQKVLSELFVVEGVQP